MVVSSWMVPLRPDAGENQRNALISQSMGDFLKVLLPSGSGHSRTVVWAMATQPRDGWLDCCLSLPPPRATIYHSVWVTITLSH